MDAAQLNGHKHWQAVITAHPLFSGFTSNKIEALSRLFTLKKYQPGEMIVTQGDIIDSFYFILSGNAEVIVASQPVATLSEGESIGLSETGFFSTTGTRTATIIALTELTAISLDLQTFRDFLLEHPLGDDALRVNADLMLRMHFIKQTLPFAKMGMNELHLFAQKIQEISIPAGTILFQQGKTGDDCYLIQYGKFEITIEDATGNKKIIAELEPPSLLGETALLLAAPRNATARALEDSLLLKIDKQLFMEMLGSDANAASSIMELQLARCRPIRLKEIEVFHSATKDGEEVITLRNARLNKYFRLPKEGLFVWERMDGLHSLHEVTMDFFDRYDVFNPGEISSLIMQLQRAGFLQLDIKEKSEKESQPIWLRFFMLINRILTVRTALGNTDDFITRTYKKTFWVLYTRPAQYIMLLISIIGFCSFIYNFHFIIEQMDLISNKSVLIFAAFFFMMCTILFHELAHGYTAKFFDRKVNAFGIGWFWVGPIAFCDTSDMWLSPAKARIAVDLAGIYANLIIAGIASLCLWFSNYNDLNVFLWLFSLFTYGNIFVNLSPLIELDGYYMLMDIMDKPNLRESATLWLINLFSKKITLNRLRAEIKENKKECLYWLICIVYTLLKILFAYIIAIYLLRGLLGVKNPFYSLMITFAVIIFSSIGIWGKISRIRRLNK